MSVWGAVMCTDSERTSLFQPETRKGSVSPPEFKGPGSKCGSRTDFYPRTAARLPQQIRPNSLFGFWSLCSNDDGSTTKSTSSICANSELSSPASPEKTGLFIHVFRGTELPNGSGEQSYNDLFTHNTWKQTRDQTRHPGRKRVQWVPVRDFFCCFVFLCWNNRDRNHKMILNKTVDKYTEMKKQTNHSHKTADFLPLS